MKKRALVALGLAVLLAASVYPQSIDFTRLLMFGTPQDVQAAMKTAKR